MSSLALCLKVKKRFEDKNINFLILDKNINYNILEKKDFEQLNNYVNVYNKAYKYINIKNKIDVIYEYLLSNIDEDIIKEKIKSIEDILYEL